MNLTLGLTLSQFFAFSKWKLVSKDAESEGFGKYWNIYRDLYPFLNTNKFFLFHYGALLVDNNEYKRGLKILHKANVYYSDTQLLCQIGRAYKELNECNLAEHYYYLASNMAPNKIYPLYCLVKLYLEMDQITEARQIALIILTKKEIFFSTQTSRIKKEMRQLFQDSSLHRNNDHRHIQLPN